MTNAYKDENGVSTMIGALNTDGKTTVRITASPTTHYLSVIDGTTGTDHGTVNAVRDQNEVPVIMAVSSADGITPVEVYVDSNGNLLTNNN